MKNINSQVLRKTFAFSHVRFVLARFTLVRFVLAAILIPALLIGSAFTFGGSNLQAQAVQNNTKSGFFAGFVYLNGFKVDTTKLVTTNSTTYTDATTTGYRIDRSSGNNGYGAITSEITVNADEVFDAPISGVVRSNGIEALLKANCKTGATTVTTDGIAYTLDRTSLHSFDEGTSKGEGTSVTTTGAGPGTMVSKFPSGTGNNGQDTSYCLTYFFGDLSSDRTTIPNYQIATPDSDPTLTSVPAAPRTNTSSKSNKLSGIGLQFGWRGEKWRASLTHFTGKGGANELANTVVMADYFFNEDFFVGGGLASMKLTNGSASGSATSPALRVGYKKNLTSNLSLNFGLTKYISGVSLKSSVTTNNTTTNNNTTTPSVLRPFEETQTEPGDSVLIGVRISPNVRAYYKEDFGTFLRDHRSQVTQVHSRTVYINKIQIPAGATETQTTTTTETDAELKAPLVISLSLHLSF